MTFVDLHVGDIVVTSADPSGIYSRLVSWFTDSKWTHLFIVLADGQLIESSLPKGVRKSSLSDRFVELTDKQQQYVVLRADITPEQQALLSQAVETWVGRRYDYLQAVLFGLFNFFIDDGPKRVICSRFVTAVFKGVGIDLFPEAVLEKRAGRLFPRFFQLRKGWAIPQDFVEYSVLEEIK